MSDLSDKVKDCFLTKRNGNSKDSLRLSKLWLDKVFEVFKGVQQTTSEYEAENAELRKVISEVVSLKCSTESDWLNLWSALLFTWFVPVFVNWELQQLVSKIDETPCQNSHSRMTVGSLKKAIADLHPTPLKVF